MQQAFVKSRVIIASLAVAAGALLIVLPGGRSSVGAASIEKATRPDAVASVRQAQSEPLVAPPTVSGGNFFPMQGGFVLTKERIAELVKDCPDCGNATAAGFTPQVIQTPPTVIDWKAPFNNPGNPPPDTQVAASSTHVVVTSQSTLAWFEKNGKKKGEIVNRDLFEPLLTSIAGGVKNSCTSPGHPTGIIQACAQSDFRVIFDSYRKRFWALDGAGIYAADVTPQTVRGILMLAVSLTEDPKDGWYLYWWDAVAHWNKLDDVIYRPGDGADYPAIGIDPFGFHQTNFVGDINGNIKYCHVTFFNADQAVQGIPADGWEYFDLRNPDGSVPYFLQPAVHHGANGRAYYVSRYLYD